MQSSKVVCYSTGGLGYVEEVRLRPNFRLPESPIKGKVKDKHQAEEYAVVPTGIFLEKGKFLSAARVSVENDNARLVVSLSCTLEFSPIRETLDAKLGPRSLLGHANWVEVTAVILPPSASFLSKSGVEMSFHRTDGTDGAEESDGSKTMEEKLVVAVRVRPLKPDEAERCLHCVDDKDKLFMSQSAVLLKISEFAGKEIRTSRSVASYADPEPVVK